MRKESMKTCVLLLALAALLSTPLAAQKSQMPQSPPMPQQLPVFSAAELAAKVPPVKPADVNSVDSIMRAVYEVITGPAGSRDWNRFRSIFLPQARFTQVDKMPDGSFSVISWSVDEFVRDATEVFSQEGFYENAIVNYPARYGNMAQVFSSYESRHAPGEKPFTRGINSMQLLNDGKRWWVVSIAWDSERPDNPLPAKFSKK
jgi:hypothetical protein